MGRQALTGPCPVCVSIANYVGGGEIRLAVKRDGQMRLAVKRDGQMRLAVKSSSWGTIRLLSLQPVGEGWGNIPCK